LPVRAFEELAPGANLQGASHWTIVPHFLDNPKIATYGLTNPGTRELSPLLIALKAELAIL